MTEEYAKENEVGCGLAFVFFFLLLMGGIFFTSFSHDLEGLKKRIEVLEAKR